MPTLEEVTFDKIKSIAKHNDGAFEKAVAAGIYTDTPADRARYAADLAAGAGAGPYGPTPASAMTPKQKQIVQLYQPSYVVSEHEKTATGAGGLVALMGATAAGLAMLADFNVEQNAKDVFVYGGAATIAMGGAWLAYKLFTKK